MVDQANLNARRVRRSHGKSSRPAHARRSGSPSAPRHAFPRLLPPERRQLAPSCARFPAQFAARRGCPLVRGADRPSHVPCIGDRGDAELAVHDVIGNSAMSCEVISAASRLPKRGLTRRFRSHSTFSQVSMRGATRHRSSSLTARGTLCASRPAHRPSCPAWPSVSSVGATSRQRSRPCRCGPSGMSLRAGIIDGELSGDVDAEPNALRLPVKRSV